MSKQPGLAGETTWYAKLGLMTFWHLLTSSDIKYVGVFLSLTLTFTDQSGVYFASGHRKDMKRTACQGFERILKLRPDGHRDGAEGSVELATR